VPGRNVEDIAGPDIEIRAVVHHEVSRSGNAEADVVELGAVGSRHGTDMLGSVPIRLQHETTDGEVADLNRMSNRVLESEDLVGIPEVLDLWPGTLHDGAPPVVT
jgi:hypothetical protein